LTRAIATDSGYEFNAVTDFFVDTVYGFGKHSYTALTFPSSDDREAAADLFGWDQSPWQDGAEFMASFQEFLAYRALHPSRSREELAFGAARLLCELVDPVREGDPRVTNPETLEGVAHYLRQVLAVIEKPSQ
jgi:hypothetical protein